MSSAGSLPNLPELSKILTKVGSRTETDMREDLLRDSDGSLGRGPLQASHSTSELIVLSQARDIALRKLRGFAASIGAKARLIGSAAEIVGPASAIAVKKATDAKRSLIVLWDCDTILLEPRDIRTLEESSFLVAAGDPSRLTAVLSQRYSNKELTGLVDMTLACPWPLSRFLDTQIARVVLGQAMVGPSSVDGMSLLRWGHYLSTWPAEEPSPKDSASATLAGLASAFGKRIAAPSDLKKNLVAVARLFDGLANKSKTPPLSLAFSSDGLLTCAIAHCHGDLKTRLDLSPATLKKLGCQAAIISEHQRDIWQLAFVFGMGAVAVSRELPDELLDHGPMVITFPRKDDDSSTKAAPLVSAAS